MEITIRQENNADFAEVYRVNELAFNQKNEAELVEKLRKSKAFVPKLSLVAVFEGKIVGYILFTENKIISDGGEEFTGLSLAPVSVLPDFQHYKIGSKLILKGLEIAEKSGYGFVIVLGHEDYYPNFGFKPAKNWNIYAPFHVPDQNFMALELRKDAFKNINGTVKYPDEFSEI